MRRFDVANRNRHKVDAALEWSPHRVLTVSPNVGLRYDDYPDPDVQPARRAQRSQLERRRRSLGGLVHPTFRLMASLQLRGSPA